jgi:hypothetical protein
MRRLNTTIDPMTAIVFTKVITTEAQIQPALQPHQTKEFDND